MIVCSDREIDEMQAVVADFEQRVTEVAEYLRMLKALDRPDAVIHSQSKASHKTTPVEDDWRKVSKATVYLLIYNLVEAAIRSAFGELYETIAHEGRSLQSVSAEIRNTWVLSEHRKLTRETASPENYREAAARMVLAALDREVVRLEASRLPVSGNLDADNIRRVCRNHGVGIGVHRAARGGIDLEIVKQQRNALAHGNRSFSEVGRDVTIEDLVRTTRQAEIFVRGILKNMEKHIVNSGYVKTETS